MRKTSKVVLVLLGLIILSARAVMAFDLTSLLNEGMGRLEAEKGSQNLCLITNAPYVRLNGQSAVRCLDSFSELTGCTPGSERLLFVQRPVDAPLVAALYDRSRQRLWALRLDGSQAQSQLWEVGDAALAQEATWRAMQKSPLGRDAFSLISIARAWGGGAPYDLLKCAEFHDHLCPGVTSGYLMARFILQRYPLKPGQRYYYVGSPVWCKEDAVQVLLNLTPGKRRMIVRPLTQEQKEALPNKTLGGLFLLWDAKAKQGRALALSFDWQKARGLARLGKQKKPSDGVRLLLALLPVLDRPQEVVGVWKESDLMPAQFQALMETGADPYKQLGFTDKP